MEVEQETLFATRELEVNQSHRCVEAQRRCELYSQRLARVHLRIVGRPNSSWLFKTPILCKRLVDVRRVAARELLNVVGVHPPGFIHGAYLLSEKGNGLPAALELQKGGIQALCNSCERETRVSAVVVDIAMNRCCGVSWSWQPSSQVPKGPPRRL
jgi:hypothetical protein